MFKWFVDCSLERKLAVFTHVAIYSEARAAPSKVPNHRLLVVTIHNIGYSLYFDNKKAYK